MFNDIIIIPSTLYIFLTICIKFEFQFVPMATDFVNVSRAQCTASDLLRMESLLLQKLEWDMFVPTPVLFLQKVH